MYILYFFSLSDFMLFFDLNENIISFHLNFHVYMYRVCFIIIREQEERYNWKVLNLQALQ